jgi:predicted  nucleic acid-binding Zn-ribbon protein
VEEAPIFNSVSSSPLDDCFGTGTIPGSGTYFCVGCGAQLSMEETEELPDCPSCGESQFRRDSIFASMQEHSVSTSEFPASEAEEDTRWLAELRGELEARGHHLAWREEDGTVASFTIERGWTRIGRSPTADLQFDDPSVSRRHALVVAEPGQGLRVLDDRSLNGVFVNGEPVEWGTLEDGDELSIGRYRLYALSI